MDSGEAQTRALEFVTDLVNQEDELYTVNSLRILVAHVVTLRPVSSVCISTSQQGG